jgi:hypothetical protein
MWRIEAPCESAGDTYRLCIQSTRDKAKRERLLSVENVINVAAESYLEAASEEALHRIGSSPDVVGVVSKGEMTELYNNQMVRKGTAARKVYDRLMSAPRHGRCPLCGQRVASTLDHYLPESIYPVFAVFPHNLVPACKDCNKEKGCAVPVDAGHQAIHPYFDDFETERWLYAEVIHTDPPAVQFFVRPPTHWSDVKKQRVKYHFNLLKLVELYASHAASEISSIRYGLINLSEDVGGEGVRRHLRSEAATRAAANVNSWQTALYEALASDHWFCEGGFAYA